MQRHAGEVRIPENVTFSELDGQAVVLDLDSGIYYRLNHVGCRMWLLLQEHGSPEAACKALLEEFDVPEARLREDLQGLIDHLLHLRLLVRDGA